MKNVLAATLLLGGCTLGPGFGSGHSALSGGGSVPPAPPAVIQCEVDADCPPGDFCPNPCQPPRECAEPSGIAFFCQPKAPPPQSCESNCDCPVNEYCQQGVAVANGGPTTGGVEAQPACDDQCSGSSPCPPCPAPPPAPQGICVTGPVPLPPGPPVEIDGGIAEADAGAPTSPCGPAPDVMLPKGETMVCSPNGHWATGPSCQSDAECVKSNPDECNICPAGQEGYACVEGACLCGCQ
ncbi:MAG: hypothetical protein ACYCWW_21310 [Deltaproteobacteria bacterium]